MKVSPDFVAIEDWFAQKVVSCQWKRCTRGHCKRSEVSGNNLVGQDQLLLIILHNYSCIYSIYLVYGVMQLKGRSMLANLEPVKR